MTDLKKEIENLDREMQTTSIALRQIVDLLDGLNDRLVNVELALAEEVEREQNSFQEDEENEEWEMIHDGSDSLAQMFKQRLKDKKEDE